MLNVSPFPKAQVPQAQSNTFPDRVIPLSQQPALMLLNWNSWIKPPESAQSLLYAPSYFCVLCFSCSLWGITNTMPSLQRAKMFLPLFESTKQHSSVPSDPLLISILQLFSSALATNLGHTQHINCWVQNLGKSMLIQVALEVSLTVKIKFKKGLFLVA